MAEDAESDIAIRFVDENDHREISAKAVSAKRNLKKNRPYYINTNEIPGELLRENLISSHVKISPLLWLYNKSRLSHQKTVKVKWFGISLVFI